MNDRVVGAGDLRFELVDGWEHVPADWHQFDVPAVCTDKAGNVYAFWRGDHRVVVYDRTGHCVDSWSEPPFDVRAPCRIYMSPQEQLYLVDEGTHLGRPVHHGRQVPHPGSSGHLENRATAGTTRRTTGPSPMARALPSAPTGAAVAPSGEVYVSDGYGNARVHRFGPTGHCSSPGVELRPRADAVPRAARGVGAHRRPCFRGRPGERADADLHSGRAARSRTGPMCGGPRAFSSTPADRCTSPSGSWPAGWESQRRGAITVHEPGRISIYDVHGGVLASGRTPDPAEPGYMLSPHGIWVDGEGSICTLRQRRHAWVSTSAQDRPRPCSNSPGSRWEMRPLTEYTRDDFERLIRDRSNWGRWGDDDEVGAISFPITPEKRAAAAPAGSQRPLRIAQHAVPDDPCS